MVSPHAVIVGAGVGGLACAIDLAARGLRVTIVEAAPAPGGKIATVPIADRTIDCGPTVLTMRWVFDRLFADAGASFEHALGLRPAECLARHAWSATERLDLFADKDRSAEAIAQFSSPREARRYRDFCEQARGIFEGLRDTFMDAPLPTPSELVWRMGFGGVGALMRASPFSDLWTALSRGVRRSTAATALRALCDLLWFVTISGAGHPDARRPRGAGRRLARRRRHDPPGAGIGIVGAGPRRAVAL